MQLQLETIAVCNAKCVFCPYPTMKRPRGLMTMPLFSKIVEEAVGLDRIESITLTGLGETLMDRHLIERIKLVRQMSKRSILVDLYTNGSYLTNRMIDDLLSAGLDVLYISLNASRADRRKEIMGLADYDYVKRQARYAIDRFGRFPSGQPRVLVKAVMSKDLMEGDDHEAFLAEWGGDFRHGGNAFLHLEGNWAGAVWPVRIRPTTACSRALSQIMVLWDGRVSLCCFDGEGDVVLGDLNSQTIREVFAGETAVKIRQAHVDGRRGELPLCGTCTAI